MNILLKYRIVCCISSSCRISSPASPSRHRYRLYSVILHLGSSLASGHYIAYVRAGDTSLDYFQCKRPISADTVKTSKKKGLFKMFSKSSTLAPTEAKGSSSLVCPSMTCCGLKISGVGPGGAASSHHVTNGDSGQANGRLSPGYCSNDITNGGAHPGGSPTPEPDLWLECDDEQISVISRSVGGCRFLLSIIKLEFIKKTQASYPFHLKGTKKKSKIFLMFQEGAVRNPHRPPIHDNSVSFVLQQDLAPPPGPPPTECDAFRVARCRTMELVPENKPGCHNNLNILCCKIGPTYIYDIIIASSLLLNNLHTFFIRFSFNFGFPKSLYFTLYYNCFWFVFSII